jgi:hypothetical protein
MAAANYFSRVDKCENRAGSGASSGFQPSLPWGRGWTAPAFSPAGAGRVRGSGSYVSTRLFLRASSFARIARVKDLASRAEDALGRPLGESLALAP